MILDKNYCNYCGLEIYFESATVRNKGYYFHSSCYYKITLEGLQNKKEEPKMENIKSGNYAVIRPNSQTGHSPSDRYKTYKQAVEVATKLCENTACTEFEVVKIIARVSSKPRVTITKVK